VARPLRNAIILSSKRESGSVAAEGMFLTGLFAALLISDETAHPLLSKAILEAQSMWQVPPIFHILNNQPVYFSERDIQ
jgi:hypothetical protein